MIQRMNVEVPIDDDDFRTRVWNGEITYGEFRARNWFGVGGVGHPLVRCVLDRLSEQPGWSDYNAYLCGGVLEPWLTWDIDIVLVGDLRSKDVGGLLRRCVAVGFDLHLYVDVQFRETDAGLTRDDDPYREGDPFYSYEYSDRFVRDGVRKSMEGYEPYAGMVRCRRRYPPTKMVQRRRSGHTYRRPIRLPRH